MVQLADVNLVGVLGAGIVSMIIGFIYYHPKVVGTPWMKEMGMDPSKADMKMEGMGKTFGLAFIAALITAYVLAQVLVFTGAQELIPALLAAGLMWAGFVAPVQYSGVLFDRKSNKLFAINTAYQLLSLIGMAVVLTLL